MSAFAVFGLELRPPPSKALIYRTWLMRYAAAMRPVTIAPDAWYDEHRAVIDELWPRVRALVDPRAPDVIHGYVCGRLGVLDWVWVGRDIRGGGLGRAMLDSVCGESGIATHAFSRPSCFGDRFVYSPLALAREIQLMRS